MFTAEQRKIFFDTIRGSVALTVENVPGFDRILDYGFARGYDREKLAYAVATAYWETGKSMKPVEEGYYLGSPARVKAFQRKLRYYPFFGRGLIQATWAENYRKLAYLLGLPEETFIKNPDLLCTWEYALPALFVGMEVGLYTGKDLDDYIDGIDESDDEDLREYVNARRIVNGTDKQLTIGKIAIVIESGLKAAGYGDNGPAPAPAPEPEAVEEELDELPELPMGGNAYEPEPEPGFWATVLDIFADLIASLFKRKQ